MKQTPIARLLAGLVILGPVVHGAESAASGALKYYPTSVAPTLPSQNDVITTREGAPRGILSALQSAYRRSDGQGWSGIPALDRSSAAHSAVMPALEPQAEAASPAAVRND